jgi:hypothetical protein
MKAAFKVWEEENLGNKSQKRKERRVWLTCQIQIMTSDLNKEN